MTTTQITKPEGYPETPNLDKMIEVSKQSQPIGEFVEWLGQQGWQIAKYGPMTGEEPCPGDAGFMATCEQGVIHKGTHRERACTNCDGTGWVTRTRDDWQTHSGGIESLLAEYFGVDKAAADKERDSVLRWVQNRD